MGWDGNEPTSWPKERPMKDTQVRTVVKTIGYRTVTLVQGFAVAYGLTGSIIQSLKFTIWTNAIGVVIYYGWERMWNKVEWGKK